MTLRLKYYPDGCYLDAPSRTLSVESMDDALYYVARLSISDASPDVEACDDGEWVTHLDENANDLREVIQQNKHLLVHIKRLLDAVQYAADHCPNDEIRHRAIDALA